MAIQLTRHFADRQLATGELAATLRTVLQPHAQDLDAIHIDLSRQLGNEVSEHKVQANWSDIEALGDIAAEQLLLRAWFAVPDKGRWYFAVHAVSETIRVTVETPTVETSQELLEAFSSELGLQETESHLERALATLEEGHDSEFDFTGLVRDPMLAEILGLRWLESERTYLAQAYLSTIILLGSILEGVLLDKMEQHPKIANQARSAPAPKGKVLEFADWSLDNLMTVAHECGWLDSDVRDFSAGLRDYRNLVHPSQQRRSQLKPDSGTCTVAREVVKAAFEDLQR